MAESKVQVKVGGNATPPNNALLDQYKQYAGDLGNIGTRYTAAQTFYFTLVSALIGVLALKDSGNVATVGTVAGYVNTKFVAVMLFVSVICYIWRETLLFYQKLFRAKFDILRQLEGIGLYTVYDAEIERLKELNEGKIPNLIDSEARIPLFLMIAAILIALLSIGYLINHPK